MKLEGHTGVVKSAAFSPDDKQIISVSFDGTVRRWNYPPLQELIRLIRNRFAEIELSPEIRKKYYLV